MKNKATFIFILAALLYMVPALALAASHVDNISLKKQGEFVELTIYADGPFTFEHFIEEAKAGKPYRVVLDLKDCLHKLPQFNFRELPTQVVSAIRSSQYKIDPEKVVRIVADVTRPVTYMVRQAEGKVTLVLSAPEEKEFSFWCAAPISESEKIELALAQSNSKSAPVTSGTTPARPESEKLAAEKGSFKLPFVKKEDKDTTLKLVQTPEKNEQPATRPEDKKAEEKVLEQTVKPQATKGQLAQVLDTTGKKTKPAIPETNKPEREIGQSAPAQVDSGLKEKAVPEKPILPPKAGNAVMPISDSMTVTRKTLTDSQPLAPVRPAIDSQPGSISPQTPIVPPGQEQDTANKLWQPEDELRNNPNSPPKAKGTLASALPARETIEYKSFGQRDPFMPLVSKGLTGYKRGELPDIEALRLVGVLQGDRRNMALLEDMEGYGFILESGDQVKNGYVIEIYNDKILFQIDEYGWSRSVALTMDLEE